jgi:iron(III) transport system permease protein
VVGGRGQRVIRARLRGWRWPARLVLLGYILVAAVMPMTALVLVALNRVWLPTINWTGLSLEMYQRAIFDDSLTSRALQNTLVIGIIGASIGMIAATLIGFLVQRSTGRVVGRILDAAIKLPAAISSIVIAVGFVLAFSGPPFNLNGTLAILLLAYLVLYMPQGAVTADAAVAQVGRELSEASHIAGAGQGRTFRRISLPLMVPGLTAGWSLLFVSMVGDSTASAILAGGRNPVVGFRVIEIFTNGSFPLLAALASVLAIISGTIVVLGLIVSRRSSWSLTPRPTT